MNQRVLQYDLYLDESGNFEEAPTNPKDRFAPNAPKSASNQIVGLLVARDTGDKEAAEIIRNANLRARFSPENVIHAHDIIDDSYANYLKVADAVIRGIQRHSEWQFVRLINAEQISYSDRATTYPNLIAELTLRTFQQKLKENPDARICIRLVDPKYKLGRHTQPLKASEYEKRVTEYLGFAEVRYGLTREKRKWRFDRIIDKEYGETPAIQICDVISHAGANNFTRIRTHKDLIAIVKRRFGDYDFTLTIRELFERVDDLVKEHSFGVALMILAEALVHAPHATKQDQEFAAKLKERLNHIVERLGRMDFRGRDPQLALLVGWLDQLVGQQRLLDKGYEIAHWLLKHVEAPLRAQLIPHKNEAATLDWFAYSLRRWALTACNHKGVLLQGQPEVEAMRSLQPSVAKQWERIPLVMDGMIAQAVHYTDCFEFDKASQQMRFVADSLKMQSNQFHKLMPQDFPDKLKFDLRARALGTLVQSEIFAGATDPARLQSAREASEEAIAEFTSFSDRARQYQYRCHLETVARDFETARKYLVKSLEGTDIEPADYSHNHIADLIREFSIDPEWKAEFTLLHWLRIGAYACLDAHEASDRALAVGGIAEEIPISFSLSHHQAERERQLNVSEPPALAGGFTQSQREAEDVPQGMIESAHSAIESERDKFLAALDRSEQLDCDACQGRLLEYPAHSILRFVAVINAAQGKWDDALLALQRLHALDSIGKEQFVLAMILIAAQAEVAALLWDSDELKARTLLIQGDHARPALLQRIQQVEAKCGTRLSILGALSQEWLETVTWRTSSTSSSSTPRTMLDMARANVY